MFENGYLKMQQDTPDQGKLKISVVDRMDNRPVEGALVRISYTGQPQGVLEEIRTNASGQTPVISLPAPPLEYSMEPGEWMQPYSEYTIQITADGFLPEEVAGTQVLSGTLAEQAVCLDVRENQGNDQSIVIEPHTLFGDYPPKESETEIKSIPESGEIVLRKVVIPEFVVVHDGPPSDANAKDHYVRYRDYIKNVASSEIYATWPDHAIRANVLAIMSFTLNRVYTEWYRDHRCFSVCIEENNKK